MSATSLRPEEKLIELIIATSHEEQRIELLRRRLVSIPNTAPFALLLRLTKGERTPVTAQMIKDFLDEKQLAQNYPTELFQLVVNRYAATSDATIDVPQFVELVLPKQDSELRLKAALQDVQSDLTPDAEEALAQLLYKEAQALVLLEPLKVDLFRNRDVPYSEQKAFAMIGKLCGGSSLKIHVEQLKKFCTEHCHLPYLPYDEQLLGFISRLDRDGDGALTMEEFCNGLSPLGIEVDEPLAAARDAAMQRRADAIRETPLKSAAKSDLLQEKMSTVQSTAVKETATKQDEERKFAHSSGLAQDLEMRRPQPATEVRRNLFSEQHASYLERDLPAREKISYQLADFVPGDSVPKIKNPKEFIVVLKRLLKIEQATENLKRELALRIDFNVYDVFHFFDEEGKGYLYLSQLERKLNELGVYTGKDDVFLLMRRYDRDCTGRLKFSDFNEMMSPVSTQYAKLLNNRSPINYSLSYALTELMSPDTLVLLRKLLKKLIADEVNVEEERVFFSKFFSTYDIFNRLDINRDGYIDVSEFREFLENNNLFTQDIDRYQLMDRFDHDEDGKISYADFLREMDPRLS